MRNSGAVCAPLEEARTVDTKAATRMPPLMRKTEKLTARRSVAEKATGDLMGTSWDKSSRRTVCCKRLYDDTIKMTLYTPIGSYPMTSEPCVVGFNAAREPFLRCPRPTLAYRFCRIG